MRDPKATLKIFSTGSITVTAPSVRNVQLAIEKIYPLVHEFQKPKTDKTPRDPGPPVHLPLQPEADVAAASSSNNSDNVSPSGPYGAKKSQSQ
ncbi:hypothetical protein TCAL_11309 [Tigriopus californicus]|uniref:Uncharacterized protein n=2 Tax=Tigriopus californicus TaxID=6832 RepID=A0A553N9S7_TIGCA|nr:hypothetical protein TCAL_11309 [Tigriopus californicus]|eukprot:TCALIF_11309-PA protein Name:"Similar to tbpl1 TATA box-binding protein-like protein 1 (Xenopus laevis)" AED:0.66 eAED:0.66 QI:0/-1/0/1/-1/1/1/0/92